MRDVIRAAGCQPVREFERGVRTKRNTSRLEEEMGLRLSAWGHIDTVKRVIDVERINYIGVVYTERDMRPRLVKH